MITRLDEALITHGKTAERHHFLSLIPQGLHQGALYGGKGAHMTRRRVILIAVVTAVLIGGVITAAEAGLASRLRPNTVQEAGGDIGWGGQPSTSDHSTTSSS